MQIGNWYLETVSGGYFWLDGGAMFGVVPKPLWEKKRPSDAVNRIRLATNCVLARDGHHTILIDTGYGGGFADRERDQMAMEGMGCLSGNLVELGLSVEDIDTVVLSHLHFDHAGGGTCLDERGEHVPTFPQAQYVIDGREWQDATSGAVELRGAYRPEDAWPLEKSGQLRLVQDAETIVPGLVTRNTGGHTKGHQALFFQSAGKTAVYLGDLCPTAAHMRAFWCMAYDVDPLQTRRCKPELLGRAADENWLLLWDHDSEMAAARIERHVREEFVVVKRYLTL